MASTHLIGGAAKYAAVYPPALVTAILRALKDQLVMDGEIGALETGVAGLVPEELLIIEDWQELPGEDGGCVNGGCLPEKETIDARKEAIK